MWGYQWGSSWAAGLTAPRKGLSLQVCVMLSADHPAPILRVLNMNPVDAFYVGGSGSIYQLPSSIRPPGHYFVYLIYIVPHEPSLVLPFICHKASPLQAGRRQYDARP